MQKAAKFLRVFCGCHCRPDRSFFWKGRQFPVCARCTGVLAGYPLGILWLLFFDHWSVPVCLLACVPLIIDGAGQQRGKWKSTNRRRLITGIFMGTATVHMFVNYHFFMVWLVKKVLVFL